MSTSETIEGGPTPAESADWGVQALPDGELGHWCIGGLDLWARRYPREWRVAHRVGDDPTLSHMQWENLGLDLATLPSGVEILRFAAADPAPLRFTPALIHLPAVVRPEDPLYLVAGADTEIFISTPLWVAIDDARPGPPLVELGTLRLRPTWFGTPAEGEKCFALRTRARLEMESLEVHPLRCVTKLVLHNRGREHLLIERIKVPIPHLSLFATSSGHFCTQTVTVVRRDDDSAIEVRFDDSPPAHATTRIAPPRQHERGLLRALNSWLG